MIVMSLDDADLKRISEKIALDRAQHDQVINERFAELEVRLARVDGDMKATRTATVGIFDLIAKDVKPALNSLVEDQKFVRNVRKFVVWIAVPTTTAVVGFWPHLVEFLKSGKW